MEDGQGPCKNCGSSREACDARVLKYPKRCCDACKENGPALTHRDVVVSMKWWIGNSDTDPLESPPDIERVIDQYNELREQCCKLASANRGELMGDYFWLAAPLQEEDITLHYTATGIRCFGHTYTTQTCDHEWFDFIIPFEKLK